MAEHKQVNLRDIFLGLQEQMQTSLAVSRELLTHPGTKGTFTELKWLQMLNDYLPKRYCVDSAFVLDCRGNISDQLDVVVYDRQYSPFLFNQENAKYVPAESVYGVFEVRQELNADNVAYAAAKAESVRKLARTSAPIPHAGGRYEPKTPPRVLAGILVLDSAWNPPLGEPFTTALSKLQELQQIDVGCVLRHGGFEVTYGAGTPPKVQTSTAETALMFFFLKLLQQLQNAGTVAAVDFNQYGKVL